MRTLNEIFYNSYLLNREQVILETYSEKTFTFSQICERVRLIQNSFYYYGVKKGDTIGILAQDTPRWNIAYFAIVNMGCIVVPITKCNDAETIHRITNAVDCKYLLLQSGVLTDRVLSELREDTPLTIIDIDTRKCILSPIKKFQRISSNPAKSMSLTMPSIDVNPQDIAAIQVNIDRYTVKTTTFTHDQIFKLAKAESLKFNMGDDDSFMSILTISNMNRKIIGVVIPILTGNKTVFKPRRATFHEIVDSISVIKPAVIYTVPKVVELVYKSEIVNDNMKALMDCGDKKMGFFVKRRLHMQGTKIYKLLGGKVRICSTDKCCENTSINKFLKASGLKLKISFDNNQIETLQ